MDTKSPYWTIPFMNDSREPVFRELADMGFQLNAIGFVLCTVKPPLGWTSEEVHFVPQQQLFPREDAYSSDFTQIAIIKDGLGVPKLRLSHFNNVQSDFMNLDRGLVEFLDANP